ncbi:MAG: tyrosine--tRNA ligase [bacterium]|nr:tyrosine--tRNA ligase [bacterium]
MDFVNELTWRGLLENSSDIESTKKLSNCSFYCGFDPTAPSLQIGNLVPFMAMVHIARAGLKPIVLLGGATGAIGDPSFKNAERISLDQKIVKENVEKQRAQFSTLFKKVGIEPAFVNNADWFSGISFIDFLRDVGKYFTMGYMLQKESIKSRISGDGLSFTEFSYMLLQAYDFFHLFKNDNCKLHVGGSDQWGNITAGLELIRKKGFEGASALTFPLITNSQGKKLGKSESGTLWIDPTLTSPFKFHQYWLNVEDRDVIRFIKLLTLLDQTKISELEKTLTTAPEKRESQKALADAMCTFIHGESATDLANKSAAVLFGGSMQGLSSKDLQDIFSDVPSTTLPKDKLVTSSYLDLLVETKLSKSKGEAKRLVASGGAYLNNERVSDSELKITTDHLLGDSVMVLRTGKKTYHLIKQST